MANNPERAKAIAAIRDELQRLGITWAQSQEYIVYFARDPIVHLWKVRDVLSAVKRPRRFSPSARASEP